MAFDLTPAEQAIAAVLPDGEVLDHFKESGLPTRRTEAWKWSDLRQATRGYSQRSEAYTGQPATERALADIAGTLIAFSNGVPQPVLDLPPGTTATPFVTTPELWSDRPVESLAAAGEGVAINVTQSPERPLIIVRQSSGDGYHADCLKLDVAPDVSVTLIEVHQVADAPFSNSLSLINLGAGAKLTRIVAQPPAPDAVVIHSAQVLQYEHSDYAQFAVCHGAAFARHETLVTQSAASTSRLNAAYRLNTRRHNDFTSQVHHVGPDCTTRQQVKGVTDDKARAIFQGKFHVDEVAQRTDATMAHNALLLADGATVNAKPELEIYADDVECAHGNTVGALDQDALFYLQQRGLPLNAARQLLIDAFYAELFEELGDELRPAVAALVQGDVL